MILDRNPYPFPGANKFVYYKNGKPHYYYSTANADTSKVITTLSPILFITTLLFSLPFGLAGFSMLSSKGINIIDIIIGFLFILMPFLPMIIMIFTLIREKLFKSYLCPDNSTEVICEKCGKIYVKEAHVRCPHCNTNTYNNSMINFSKKKRPSNIRVFEPINPDYYNPINIFLSILIIGVFICVFAAIPASIFFFILLGFTLVSYTYLTHIDLSAGLSFELIGKILINLIPFIIWLILILIIIFGIYFLIKTIKNNLHLRDKIIAEGTSITGIIRKINIESQYIKLYADLSDGGSIEYIVTIYDDDQMTSFRKKYQKDMEVTFKYLESHYLLM